MNVLLIQPPIEDFYTTPIRRYPLGLLYAARVFESAGWKVRILDGLSPPKKRRLPVPDRFAYLVPYFKADPHLFKRYYRFGRTDRQIMDGIDAASPDLIAISSQFTAYFETVAALAMRIKQRRDVPVIIGGNHASVFRKEILKRTPAIDAVLPGPAETAVPAYLSRAEGMDAAPVAAVDWREIQPAHELLRGDDYRMGKKNSISLIASRGCPYGCDFCSVQAMFGRSITYRSAHAVVDEMRRAHRLKRVRIFNFEDDNLTFDRTWFSEFLELVIRDRQLSDIELTAMNGLCYAHLDTGLLTLMRRAGFRQLNLSLVTHDRRLRAKYRRPGADSDLAGIVAAARRLGFFVTVYVIIGLPEQTYEEIRESVDFLFGLGVLVGPSVFYLPPGSRMFDRLDIPGSLRDNWPFYRSSAFAVETRHLNRARLIELFSYVRRRNLENRP